ncbi:MULTISPECIES: GAF and ANTAR domain-containing protein [unclassified Geodermatophilus]|uniref:GAF and ANTAR domain-containing protein n=1 Tax=unclassified Geodermatophilus TaxID=2637632 RepID=UPI003EEE9A5D
MAGEQRLVQVFVELADTLVDEFDVVDFLQVLTERCVELVDTDAAGLMLDDQRGTLQVVAATHESARLLELFELQKAEGPCLECFATGQAIANIDLSDAGNRWPRFAAAARDLGFAVSHALPLRLRRQVIGALNLFTVEPKRLSDDDLAVARGLADVATIGLLHERAIHDQVVLSEQLQAALHSRILIEQAKGVLSARAGTSVDEAFRLLRTHARRTGRTLTGVADAVIAGTLGVDELGTDRSTPSRPAR